MITVDCTGEGSVQNGRKSDDVICERSVNRKMNGSLFQQILWHYMALYEFTFVVAQKNAYL